MKTSTTEPRAKSVDQLARFVALVTFALAAFNTYLTFDNKTQDDDRYVRVLLDSAWDELAGAEAALGIPSSAVQTRDQRRKLKAVRRMIDLALETEPRNPLGLTLKGIYFAKLQMPDRAREMLEEALRADPKFAHAKSAFGRLLADEQDFEAAITEFRAATKMNPSLPTPYLGWAACLRELERLDEAVVVLRRGIETEPSFAPFYLDLGNIYLAQKMPAKALEQYRKCRDIDDLFATCYQNEIIVLLRDAQKNEASELISQAQEIGLDIRLKRVEE